MDERAVTEAAEIRGVIERLLKFVGSITVEEWCEARKGSLAVLAESAAATDVHRDCLKRGRFLAAAS